MQDIKRERRQKTKGERVREREETSNDVDHVAAGKVNAAPLGKVAHAPEPVSNDAVHEKMPEEEEDKHGMKLHAIGEGASRDDGAVKCRRDQKQCARCN